MEELLQWVFLSGTDTAVTQTEDGEITADRPETEEKFRAIFKETGLRSFFGVLLKDEEGKLGVLGFESKEPLVFDEETRDLLSILVNQATVAVRNAQLYQQVPLAGFLQPLLERRRKFLGDPGAPAPGLGHRRAARRARSRRRPLAAAGRRPGPAPARQPGGRDGRRRRRRQGGPPPRGRPGRGRATSSRRSRTRPTRRRSPRPGPRSRSPRARSPATRRRATPARCSTARSRRDELQARRALAEEQLAQDAPARARRRRHRDAAHRAARRAGARARRRVRVVADAGSVTAEVAVPGVGRGAREAGRAGAR